MWRRITGVMHRNVALLAIVVLAGVVTGFVAGCGSGRSVLYSGVSPSLGGPKKVVTDAAALHDARLVRREWVAQITQRAYQDPSQRFANLPARQLRLCIADEAVRYHFTVQELRLLHPRQVAPLVIVQSSRYVAFAHAVPAIEKSLDPHTGRSDRAGWAFEGFMLEAQDERGVPFLSVFNFWRGSGPGGGQWARADQLYPFGHL